MERAPCCENGVRKGPWAPEEDRILVSHIQSKGHKNWRALPKQASLMRCGKSCRLPWLNYLRSDIKRGNIIREEEDIIIDLQKKLGNKWSTIAAALPGRTDNEIKNVWHTYLKKRAVHYESATKAVPIQDVRDATGGLPGVNNSDDHVTLSPNQPIHSGTSSFMAIMKELMNACTKNEYESFWKDALPQLSLNCDIVSKPALSLSSSFSSHCYTFDMQDDEINGWLSLYMASGNLREEQAM